MSTAKNEPPLALGINFKEAMSRFANADPTEIKGDKRLDKKARGLRPPAKVKDAG